MMLTPVPAAVERYQRARDQREGCTREALVTLFSQLVCFRCAAGCSSHATRSEVIDFPVDCHKKPAGLTLAEASHSRTDDGRDD